METKKRATTDTQIQMSNGNWTTRINPVKRNSYYGFAVRQANKSRRGGFFPSTIAPIFNY